MKSSAWTGWYIGDADGNKETLEVSVSLYDKYKGTAIEAQALKKVQELHHSLYFGKEERDAKEAGKNLLKAYKASVLEHTGVEMSFNAGDIEHAVSLVHSIYDLYVKNVREAGGIPAQKFPYMLEGIETVGRTIGKIPFIQLSSLEYLAKHPEALYEAYVRQYREDWDNDPRARKRTQ